jgi:hypothetical protein
MIPAMRSVAAVALVALFTSDDPVPYPEGYRGWTHVASSVIAASGMSQGGIHNVYANAPALEGYRTGRFADGSIIVGDLLLPQVNGTITTTGARVRVAVMHRDSARFAATGGWGFEQFRGDSRTDRMVAGAEGAARCFGCHNSRAGNSFVFSTFRQ